MRGRGTVRGVFAGVLTLAALYRLGTTPAASKRVGGAFSDVAGLIERALSPDVPAIPDRRAAAAPDAEAPPKSSKTPRLPIPAPPK